MRQQMFLMTAVAALLTTAAVEAMASTLVALTGNQTLATIDSDTATLLGRTSVSGLDSPLVGIDVRPADGQLYGVTRNGMVVTIDPVTGSATFKSRLTQALPARLRTQTSCGEG